MDVSDEKAQQKPRLGSTRNPAGEMFNPKDLPKELVEGMDIEAEVLDAATIDPKEVILSWVNHRYPTIANRQECEDVLSGHQDRYNKHTFNEIQFGAKLALIAYAMPYFMQRITSHLHMRNNQFLRYLESFVAESTYLCYKNMDEILQGERNMIEFPTDSQVCGFYVRTPIQLWDKDLKPVYTIPQWENRTQLLDYFVSGPVNVYVLRRNLEDGYECYVTFRGTSNEFNAIPQYGRKMNATPVYRVPQYDPIENKFYEDGSNSVPLFYHHYIEMVNNVLPHIIRTLGFLGADEDLCKRIVVSGHSMGGALTLAFCFLLKHKYESLWRKSEFRSYAAPMSCNDAAVLVMEQWMIDSMQPNKYLEVVNTDDFVNIQYLLGGKSGLKKSIKEGTNRLASWLLSTYWTQYGGLPIKTPEEQKDQTMVQRMMRIVQLYPEVALSAFMNGAVQAQIESGPDQRSAAVRLGSRQAETDVWGTRSLKETYNGTMKVFFCKRNIQWQTEYIGKSHSNYVDLNMNILWAPLRMYEDNLYRFYADHSLRDNNELRIVGMFTSIDFKDAQRMVETYHPKPYVPISLKMYRFDSFMDKPPNIVDYERSKKSRFGSHSDRHHRLKK